jgi:predicted component of type VI protein secretion system
MEVKLIVSSGKSAGKEIPVTGEKFLIGRAEDCHLKPHSEEVSRYHCAILVEEGFVAVRELGSKNGTFVNGRRVKTEQELKIGDRLTIGPLDFEVRWKVDVGGKKKPKVKSIQEAAARTVESAGAGAAEGDMDVSDWLTEGEEATVSDTDPLGTVPTEQVEVDPFAGLMPSAGEQEEAEPQKPSGKQKGPPKPMADSSRAAAADVLRQLFHRK